MTRFLARRVVALVIQVILITLIVWFIFFIIAAITGATPGPTLRGQIRNASADRRGGEGTRNEQALLGAVFPVPLARGTREPRLLLPPAATGDRHPAAGRRSDCLGGRRGHGRLDAHRHSDR